MISHVNLNKLPTIVENSISFEDKFKNFILINEINVL